MTRSNSLQPRARQNVVFELGFFFGSLGRRRVCAVYEKDVELPSDLHGFVYVGCDQAGRWKYDLAKEIKAAGYDVDLNKGIIRRSPERTRATGAEVKKSPNYGKSTVHQWYIIWRTLALSRPVHGFESRTRNNLANNLSGEKETTLSERTMNVSAGVP